MSKPLALLPVAASQPEIGSGTFRGPGIATARDRGAPRGTWASVGVGVAIRNEAEAENRAGSAVHAHIGADAANPAQLLNAGSGERAVTKQLWELALEDRAIAQHDRGAGVVLFEGGRFVAYRHSERVGEFVSAEEAQGALEAA